MAEQCPWKIHWGVGQESTTRCDREAHVSGLLITEHPGGRFSVAFHGDGTHSGPGLAHVPEQRIHWQAGDRHEYTGEWPGFCDKLPGVAYESGGCTFHLGHHGRCAP